jgi:hypothetical protein
VRLCVVSPLLQAKVYGAVDPLGVKSIAPLFCPQLVFVTAEEMVTDVEALTVKEEVAVQPLELVVVTL